MPYPHPIPEELPMTRAYNVVDADGLHQVVDVIHEVGHRRHRRRRELLVDGRHGGAEASPRRGPLHSP